MIKNIDIDLLYQPLIEAPPVSSQELYGRAASGDQATMKNWRDIWISHTQANKEKFKSFADQFIGKLYEINKNKPAIILGSGPSLKTALPALKKNAAMKTPMLTVLVCIILVYSKTKDFMPITMPISIVAI